jgi:hypothetical protein
MLGSYNSLIYQRAKVDRKTVVWRSGEKSISRETQQDLHACNRNSGNKN